MKIEEPSSYSNDDTNLLPNSTAYLALNLARFSLFRSSIFVDISTYLLHLKFYCRLVDLAKVDTVLFVCSLTIGANC